MTPELDANWMRIWFYWGRGWVGGGQGQDGGIQALAAMVFLIQSTRGRILVKTPGMPGRAQGVWPQDVIP